MAVRSMKSAGEVPNSYTGVLFLLSGAESDALEGWIAEAGEEACEEDGEKDGASADSEEDDTCDEILPRSDYPEEDWQIQDLQE